MQLKRLFLLPFFFTFFTNKTFLIIQMICFLCRTLLDACACILDIILIQGFRLMFNVQTCLTKHLQHSPYVWKCLVLKALISVVKHFVVLS